MNLANPELADELAERRWAESDASGAQCLVAYCTNCAVQLAGVELSRPVDHIFGLIFGLETDYRQIAARIRKIDLDQPQ